MGTTGADRLELYCADVVVAACSIFVYVHESTCLFARFVNDVRCRYSRKSPVCNAVVGHVCEYTMYALVV